VIKRNTDLDSIDNFLDVKYHEINKNDASEVLSEEDIVVQKRDSSHLHKSIRKLEKAIDQNDDLLKSLILSLDDSEETAQLVAKDLDDVEAEIDAMDDDIVGLLESAKLLDNSIHKRVRHKREAAQKFTKVAIKLYGPMLEEKKREKRLVQEKLAEVRDEYIRCKKSATMTNSECDRIYEKIMERFREITRKFKEIEDIVNEMEQFKPTKRDDSDEDDDKDKKSDEDRKKSGESEEGKNKKDKKKKDKKKKKSEESDESPEEKKKDKHPKTSTTTTTTAFPLETSEFPTTIVETTTEQQTTIDSTTIEVTTGANDEPDSAENVIPRDNEERFDGIDEETTQTPTTVSPLSQIVQLTTTTEACPAPNHFRNHPKFQEDLADSHDFFTVDQMVARKHETPSERFLDDASILIDDAKKLLDDAFGNNKKDSDESKEVQAAKPVNIGASGPFIALCEQVAKQSKQASPQQFDQHNFAAVPIPLNGFTNPPIQFPSTGETTKTSSKIMMNPGFNLMPYPVCFVNYPQYRMQQPHFYYPGLIPMTQPGGKVDNHDTIDPEFIRSWNSRGF
jgi:hypothetical protein